MTETNMSKLLKSADSDLQNLLDSMVEALNGDDDAARRIEKLLDSAIAFYDSDRAYVIEGDTELVAGINTHERCAAGIESQQDTLKDMTPDVYTHWLGIFQRFENVVIPDMEAIKDERPNEYRYFNDSDVHSLIVVPFNKCITKGFIGVDNPKKHMTDPMPLHILSFTIVPELNEIKLTREKDALLQVSQYPENSAYVYLLGQFRISARGGTLYQDKFTQQGQALLTVLLLHKDKIFSVNEIYELISQDKESGNPTSVVNSAVYRVRNTLSIIGLKDLLICTRGTYSVNPDFNIECDAERFLNFYQAMKDAVSPAEKLEQGHNALQLYNNPLPGSLSSSVRWTLECSNLNTRFLNAAMECVRLHIEQKEYSLAYEVALEALTVEPDEPEMILLMARAMKLAGRPGLKAYIKNIMQFLNEGEQNKLKEILEEDM